MTIRIIVTGATSQVGDCLLPILCQQGFQVVAISRNLEGLSGVSYGNEEATYPIEWIKKDIGSTDEFDGLPHGDALIHLAPLSLLAPLLPWAVRGGVKRIVAFSSTGRFSKARSNDLTEQSHVQRLAQGEDDLAAFCRQYGIAWTIFRPTLIYGVGRDRNVMVIARFIQRFGFFPLLGESNGLRQPVHVEDLAKACLDVLNNPSAFNRAYNLSGGEVLNYRAMVERIFQGLGKSPRFVKIPFVFFRMAMALVSYLPRYRDFNPEMARRMNDDLAFDHTDAFRDFGYAPRRFQVSRYE
jgi:nucleoside-diphosphate-sugar epimerase